MDLKTKRVYEVIADLYYNSPGGRRLDPAELEGLLDSLEYSALPQALRHGLETVFSYSVDTTGMDVSGYRGSEMFGGRRAVRVYAEPLETGGISLAGDADHMAVSSRYYELWLTEDIAFHLVSCVATEMPGCRSEYREDKGGPVEAGMDIPLEELTGALSMICDKYLNSTAPVYEL